MGRLRPADWDHGIPGKGMLMCRANGVGPSEDQGSVVLGKGDTMEEAR